MGFDHEIAEDAARPDIAPEQARALAEDFLRTRAHRDPASLDFVETSSVTRPQRVDRVFTWKERDFDVHDATNRVAVTVLGNEVGGYSEYLKIPEQWTRDYERLRSKNNEAQTFDTAGLVALVIGLIVVIVMRVRRQDVRWRRAAIVGCVGMALSFLSSLNEFPLAEFGYPTADSYGSFVMQNLLQALMGALGWGGALFLITAGAEALYREAFPGQISLGSLFGVRGLRTRRFFRGTILGVALCAVFFAYQTVFYIVASKLGAWSPGGGALQRSAEYQISLAVRADHRVSAGGLGGVWLPHVRHPVSAQTGALDARGGGAGGVHLGVWPLRLPQSTLLHTRPGSGSRRRGAGLHHGPLGHSADAGDALLV